MFGNAIDSIVIIPVAYNNKKKQKEIVISNFLKIWTETDQKRRSYDQKGALPIFEGFFPKIKEKMPPT